MTIDEAKIFIQNAMEQSRNALAELMLIMPKVFAAKRKSLGEYYSNLENCKKEIQACEIAVKALEEVQQYRAIGTPEELQNMKSDYFEALSDWRQYRKIGTLEECRAAVEQTAKKPIFSHNLSDTLSAFHCECGNTIKVSHDIGIMNNNNAPNYCSNCGCRFDWSDEE